MTLQGWPPSGRSTRTNEQAKIPDELGRRQPRKLCWAVPRLCWAPDPRTGKGQRQASRWLPAVSAAWGSSRGGACDVAPRKAWVSCLVCGLAPWP